MPLLRLQDLPSLDRVSGQGARVVERTPENATRLDIGLLNMMPDRALAATERQFLKLLDSHEERYCAVRLFTIKGIPRGDEGRRHLQQYYRDCSEISDTDLDALIITGANVTKPDLTSEPFWADLADVLRQADHRRLPVVCSCLAAHASALIFHKIERHPLPRKRWGIFDHSVREADHPLVAHLPVRFEMPHSRFNEVPERDLRERGVEVLITGPQAGVQMAVEPDGRRLYFQGHPEYESVSLLKEYKREILRYIDRKREDYPPLPDNTFSESAADRAKAFRELVLSRNGGEDLIKEFPEELLAREMRHSWQDVSRQLFHNWLGSLSQTAVPVRQTASPH